MQTRQDALFLEGPGLAKGRRVTSYTDLFHELIIRVSS